MNDLTHNVILAMANRGTSEKLIIAAKAVGAMAGIIIPVRGIGIEDGNKSSGISDHADQEVVAILAKKEESQNIMSVLVDSDVQGTVFSLPVDKVEGVL